MPAVSEKQASFMRAIAHGWKPTQKPYKNKELPSKKVAQEFSHMAHGGTCGHYAHGGNSINHGNDCPDSEHYAYGGQAGGMGQGMSQASAQGMAHGMPFASGGMTCPKCGHNFSDGGEVELDETEAPFNYMEGIDEVAQPAEVGDDDDDEDDRQVMRSFAIAL